MRAYIQCSQQIESNHSIEFFALGSNWAQQPSLGGGQHSQSCPGFQFCQSPLRFVKLGADFHFEKNRVIWKRSQRGWSLQRSSTFKYSRCSFIFPSMALLTSSSIFVARWRCLARSCRRRTTRATSWPPSSSTRAATRSGESKESLRRKNFFSELDQ